MNFIPLDIPSRRLPVTTRRGALSLLGLAGLAAASAPAAKALSFGWISKAPVDLDGLPGDWVRHQGGVLNDYACHLSSLRLTRITLRQVIESHAKAHGNVWNALPPKVLWKNLGATLKVVDRIAADLDQPVHEIISAYRTPAYNARCPGAKSSSWHQLNYAVDVRFATRPSVVTALARNVRSKGYFSGGVGGYGNFTHIDTRGTNLDW
jgi:hypothetical protein